MPKINQSGAAFTMLLIIFLVVGLIIAVAFLGQVTFFNNPNQPNNPIFPRAVPNQKPATPSASPKDVDTKIAELRQELLRVIDQNKSTNSASNNSASTQTPTSNPSQVNYVYFGVNGSTSSTSWADLPGSDIKFNTTNYPGAKAFYFQASLQSDAPDRTAYARVYDVGNAAGVVGSDIKYAGSLTATFKESSNLTFGSGDLTLRVQLHSDLNMTTIYNPRIKIVY